MKSIRILFVIFFGLGSVFLIVAGASYWNTRQFLAGAATADGMVIENVYRYGSRSGTYHPRVRFRSGNGQDVVFVAVTGSRPPSYQVGQRVPVVYSPANPAKASIDNFATLWLLPLIFGILGAVFSSIGIGPLFWQRHVQRRDDWLRANGRRILADFERVELNTSIRVNGACPYRIVCQWLDPASNLVHVFRSHNLWYDPARYITGKTMEVMVDPDNLKRYVVETSFLPKLAE